MGSGGSARQGVLVSPGGGQDKPIYGEKEHPRRHEARDPWRSRATLGERGGS